MITIKENTSQLFVRNENGTYNATTEFTEEQAIHLAKEILLAQLKNNGEKLNNISSTRDYLRLHFAKLENEVFTVLCLDSQLKLIDSIDIARGSIDRAALYPREVLKYALKCNASSVIFGHNHPGGIATPSADDIKITQRLVDLLKQVDVTVHDHLIIGVDDSYSFSEHGRLLNVA
jgi:DNA repair protein RadC